MGNYTPQGNLYGAFTGSIYSVTGSVGGTVVMEENPLRNGAILYNGTDQTCYVAFGDRASTAGLYSFRLTANERYDLQKPIYTGNIVAVWPVAPTTGTLQATETA
jgi:hypothetical protein